MKIPNELGKKLNILLEYYGDSEKFFKEKDNPYFKGLRVNTLKCSLEKFSNFNIASKSSPFCREGFYINSDERLGANPLHHAGAFYLQEPSATSAVTVLNPQKNDYVLDLCAAPGGKSTQIAAALGGTGLIWSNEIVYKRAGILLSNFERIGVPNGVISCCHPDILCSELAEAFDKVLVDAPCSGEGMMRKEKVICEEWSHENVLACAARQQKILNSAANALKCGGILVYSTCTFAKEENEDNITEFLNTHPDFELCKIDVDFGREGIGMPFARRVLWQDGGEGHFVAKLKKTGNAERRSIEEQNPETFRGRKPQKNKLNNLTNENECIEEFKKFATQNGITLPNGKLNTIAGKLYLSTGLSASNKIQILRNGIFLGELGKNRFVPSHAMFATPFIKTESCINLELSDNRVGKFLHGEEITANVDSGFCRVCIEGIPCGFGKLSGGSLKNYYPKGLRTL